MTTLATGSSRHELMDTGRGFAILGILWLNIFVVAIPFAALALPGVWGEADPIILRLNIEIWNAVSIYVDGVMRAMISMLFGASALVMIQNAEISGQGIGALDSYFRRLLWLIAFGLIHAYILLWPYDILFLYGLFGLLLFPFRHSSPRKLLTIGLFLVFCSIVVGANQVSAVVEAQNRIDMALDEELIEQGRAGDALLEQVAPDLDDETAAEDSMPGEGFAGHPEATEIIAEIVEEIEARRAGYLDNLVSLAPASFEEQTSEVLSHHFLDVVPLLLFGMALLKTGFLKGTLSTRAYAIVASLGMIAGWGLGRLSNGGFDDGSALAWLSETAGEYTYDPRRIAFALGYFSLLALLMRTSLARRLTSALAACGRLALTLYVGQTLACGFLFYGFGLGLFGDLDHAQVAAVALVMTLFQIVAAPLYLRFFRQGPLELLLRRLSMAGSGAGKLASQS